jgi:hypothetical protein
MSSGAVIYGANSAGKGITETVIGGKPSLDVNIVGAGGVAGNLVQGTVAHDAVDANNPVKIGGKASSSKPTAVADGDRVNAYYDIYGRLHVFDEGGGGVGGGGSSLYILDNVNSLGMGSAAYLAATTLTLAGLSFTPSAQNIVKVEQYTSTGVFVASFSPQQNTITYSGSTLTVTGATFGATDLFVVYAQGPERTTNLATNSQGVVESNPLNVQVQEFSLFDGSDVAASQQYYPSALGGAMMGGKNLSFTGSYTNAHAGAMVLSVWGSNDEDTAAGWVQVMGYLSGYTATVTSEMTIGTVVNAINNSVAQTITFAWDFDNFNYKYYRFGFLPPDATNVDSFKGRISY